MKIKLTSKIMLLMAFFMALNCLFNHHVHSPFMSDSHYMSDFLKAPGLILSKEISNSDKIEIRYWITDFLCLICCVAGIILTLLNYQLKTEIPSHCAGNYKYLDLIFALIIYIFPFASLIMAGKFDLFAVVIGTLSLGFLILK